MPKLRVPTSDLSIISGCKSLLCQPAVKGANMPWPLNLKESLCRSVVGSSLHGDPTLHKPNACNRTQLCDSCRQEKGIAYPFSSVESDWADGAEPKCLTDASNKLSACPWKLAVPVTHFTRLLACVKEKGISHEL